MHRIEDVYHVPTVARVDTMSTLGQRSRLVSVNDLVQLLLAAVVVANIVGIVIASS